VAKVLSISTDLMLGSRVEGALSAAGHEVVTSGSLDPAKLSDAEVVVADLDVADLAALAAAGLPVLGYYSHVDVETKARAEAAGIDKVVPRSRMSRELPELVAALLAA
jgi:hypothetical protein